MFECQPTVIKNPRVLFRQRPIFPFEVFFTISHSVLRESVADSRLYHGRVVCTFVGVTQLFFGGGNSISDIRNIHRSACNCHLLPGVHSKVASNREGQGAE